MSNEDALLNFISALAIVVSINAIALWIIVGWRRKKKR